MNIRYLLLLLFLVPASLRAQDVPVPVETHFPLLIKVLSFNRQFEPWKEKSKPKRFRIGVVYQSNLRSSLLVMKELEKMTGEKGFEISGLPVKLDFLDLSREEPLSRLTGQCQALYIAPLRAVDVTSITKFAQTNKMVTITGVPSYLSDGASTSIEEYNGKSRIVIHLSNAKACETEYSSQLLKLARVITN